MDDMCARCIFKAEHEAVHDAWEWCGMQKEKAAEDLSYLEGLHFAIQKIVEMLEKARGGAEQSTTTS